MLEFRNNWDSFRHGEHGYSVSWTLKGWKNFSWCARNHSYGEAELTNNADDFFMVHYLGNHRRNLRNGKGDGAKWSHESIEIQGINC